MLTPSLQLLRRTLTVCLALAAAISGSAYGQSGQTFTCSNATITPNNQFTITCTATTQPTTAVPVITSANTASGTVGQAFSFTITASNSPTSFAASGLPAGLSINATTGVISGTPTAQVTASVSVTAANANGMSTPQTLTITIGPAGAAPPPPPPPPPPPAAGCPTTSYIDLQLDGGGQSNRWTYLLLPTNNVGTFTLPTVNPGHHSGTLYLGMGALGGSGNTSLEITISKCKGEINPAAGACYFSSQLIDTGAISWVGVPTAFTPDVLATFGFCNAQQSEGTWYVNIRYQFQSCSQPGGRCGYQWWWYDGWL